jgi:Na+/citrate or Na+/malate symporter
MNPISTIIGYLVGNPLTSVLGACLFLTHIGAVFTQLGNGTPIMTVLGGPDFAMLMTGFAALAAKDCYVTGGTKQQ